MKNTSTNITFILAFLVLALLPCFPGGRAWGADEVGETERERTWLEKARGDETKVEYYGILLDQDDQPVEGATVHYEITRAFIKVPLKTSWTVKTKKDGRFEIHGMKASVLRINEIELKGYEYTRYLQGPDCTSIEFRRSRTAQHHPDKNKPVEFRIRRKNKEAVFMYQTGFCVELTRNPDSLWCAYDLNRGYVPQKKKDRNDYFHDFEISGTFDEQANVWKVTLVVNGKKNDVLQMPKKLYEAPDSGYVKEITMEIPADKEYQYRHVEDYLYARIRDCGMYARFEIKGIIANANKLRIEGDAFINPFGDRCLERLIFRDGDTALSVKYSNDTEKAMRKQELLPRPDFEQWIKEGRAKY